MYAAYGSNVFFAHTCGDRDLRVTCIDGLQAEDVAKLLNLADYYNNVKRQYTKSARIHAEAEALPGVKFVDFDPTV